MGRAFFRVQMDFALTKGGANLSSRASVALRVGTRMFKPQPQEAFSGGEGCGWLLQLPRSTIDSIAEMPGS